jgi:excinuclease ABC subunit A
VRGYGRGRFSFNVHGGRCEACEGQGQLRSRCSSCRTSTSRARSVTGRRFNRETLQVKFKGKSIADVLDTDHRAKRWKFSPPSPRWSQTADVEDVGPGIHPDRPARPTLSGGEAQRVKLSRELSKRSTGHTLYVLDEPSVGLHAADVHRLIEVLQQLVDEGNTVMIIEHNLDIIKVADWVIDLGRKAARAAASWWPRARPSICGLCG